MRHLITGAAGFIGSQLADALLGAGGTVAGVDDFYLGKPAHLTGARANPRFALHRGRRQRRRDGDERVPRAGRRRAARHRLAPGRQQRHRCRRRRPVGRLPPHAANHVRDHRCGQGGRCARHRLRLDFRRLRRGRPAARRGRRSVAADLQLRRGQARRRGAALRRGGDQAWSASGSSAFRTWSGRAPRTARSSTSPAASPAARRRCACWATGPRPSPTCTSAS